MLTNKAAKQIIDKLHKCRIWMPPDRETRKFLEDVEFHVLFVTSTLDKRSCVRLKQILKTALEVEG